MRIPKVEIFKGKDGQFYWTFEGGNGEPQCSAEGFTREADAHRAFNGTLRNMLIYAATHGIAGPMEAPEEAAAVDIKEVAAEVKKDIERDIRMHG